MAKSRPENYTDHRNNEEESNYVAVSVSGGDTNSLTYRGAKSSVSAATGEGAVGDVGRRTDVSWRRILLLVVAITVHNVPEGLAVGVGFGAIGKSQVATFEKARNLAIGIGLQNFSEGLAVSLPLLSYGFSKRKAFWWGQLSGMVEPIAGLLGAVAVSLAEPILPYALSFAAGAMIFVVADDLLPEASSKENGKLASIWCIIGFTVMMAMDVGLG